MRSPFHLSCFLVVVVLLATSNSSAEVLAERSVRIDFGEVILGDAGSRAVFVRVNDQVDETWQRLFDPEPPFVNTTPDGPVEIADTFAFIFEFRPLVPGRYRDSTVLVRSVNGQPRDTIRVRMEGVGRSLTASQDLRFPLTMTGDFIPRWRSFFGPEYVVDQYEVLHRPDDPFVTAENPVTWDRDSLRVGVAFEPRTLDVYEDSLVLIRRGVDDRILDTLHLNLYGFSTEMKPDTTVDFTGVTVGSVDTMLVFLRLPAFFITRQFQYDIVSLDPGPMRAEVEPDRPTRRAVMTCRIIASPDEFRNVRQRFVMRRRSEQTDELWDSTIINVDLLMAPRPIRYDLVWNQNPVSAEIGDTVALVLQAVTEDVFDADIAIDDIRVELAYNPTTFVPLTSPGQTRSVVSDSTRWTITLPRDEVISSGPVTPLATLRAVVALGDADHSPLTPLTATLTVKGSDPRRVRCDTNRLNITNVFRYGDGTPRYVNPLQQGLEISIDPNPVISSATLTVENVPDGRGALDIIDVMGQVVADLSSQLRSGVTTFTVASGSGGDVDLMPGSYYARLTVQGDQPNSLARVVRLLIVQ